MNLSPFDKKLRIELQKYRDETGERLYEIAKNLHIHEATFYNFNAGQRPLNPENTHKLLNYLNLTVHLEKKS